MFMALSLMHLRVCVSACCANCFFLPLIYLSSLSLVDFILIRMIYLQFFGFSLYLIVAVIAAKYSLIPSELDF